MRTPNVPPLTYRVAPYLDFERARKFFLHWYLSRKKARWN